MIKNTNLCVDLKTVMQQDPILTEGHAYNGVLTRDGYDHFIFEEAVRKGRPKRNPKLFDGNYISMVHMQNGKYQCHMKTITAQPGLSSKDLAFQVYIELVNALSIIDE